MACRIAHTLRCECIAFPNCENYFDVYQSNAVIYLLWYVHEVFETIRFNNLNWRRLTHKRKTDNSDCQYEWTTKRILELESIMNHSAIASAQFPTKR